MCQLKDVFHAVETVRDNLTPGLYRETLTRLVVFGGLLRAKEPTRFPFIGSPREKDNTPAATNHDFYLLRWRKHERPRKLACLLRSRRDYEQRLMDGRESSVRAVYVLPMLEQIISNYPAIRQEVHRRTNPLPEGKRADELLRYAIELTYGQNGGQQKRIAGAVTESLNRTILSGINNEAKARRARTPLTHDLGSQLQKFLEQ